MKTLKTIGWWTMVLVASLACPTVAFDLVYRDDEDDDDDLN